MSESLSLDERIRKYRKLAIRAFHLARQASDKNLRAGYFTMAAAWHSLAADAERARGRLAATHH